jgi:hypothetical protein
VSAAPGRHPSDADRERAALPVLEELVRTAREEDERGLAACYDDEVAWLEDGVTLRGRDAAVARHRAIAAAAAEWAAPHQQGARAVLRWRRPPGPGDAPARSGALVVEVRRGRVVFAAAV